MCKGQSQTHKYTHTVTQPATNHRLRLAQSDDALFSLCPQQLQLLRLPRMRMRMRMQQPQ